MRMTKINFRNWSELPQGEAVSEPTILSPTHVGKEDPSQRMKWEIEKLLEGGLRPSEEFDLN